MNLLENYLDYLNKSDSLNEATYDLGIERDTAKRGIRNFFRGAPKTTAAGAVARKTTDNFGKFIVHNAKVGASGSIWWSLAITLGLGTAWKGLNFAFSKAYRKCGFSKGPGKKMCMARERIKILQQKQVLLSRVLSNCGKSKDPILCKQQGQLEIEKVKNKIESNKNKLKEGEAAETIESIDLSEQAAMAAGAAALATSVAAGYAVDFVTQKAWRTATAMFSQASRKCGVYKKEGPTRNLCISQYKLISLNKQLAVINQMMSKCATQKNPDDCKEKMGKKLEKLKIQMQIQKDNIIGYKREEETERKEKEMKLAEKERKKAEKNM